MLYNKTGLLLPDLKATSIELKKEEKSAFYWRGFRYQKPVQNAIFGRVNPFLLLRITGIFAAGLFDWWTNMNVNKMRWIKNGF